MRCPQCGAELDFEHTTCSECGANLSDESATAPEAGENRSVELDNAVMAKWTDFFWYHAVIDEQRGRLRHVRFWDGFEMWCDPQDYTSRGDDPSADIDGRPLELCQQVEVLCPDNRWRPGLIDAVYGRVWHVSFHDGIQAWVEGELLRADEEDAGVFSRSFGEQEDPPGRGARVLARLPNGLWFPGMIGDEQDELRRVLFFVGQEIWLEAREVSSLATATVATDSVGAQLEVGARVMGRWTDGRWYPGTADARFGKLWHVHFDDYDQAWLEADAIRVDADGADSTTKRMKADGPFVDLDPGPPETSTLLLAAHRRLSRWKIISLIALLVGIGLGSCLTGRLGV